MGMYIQSVVVLSFIPSPFASLFLTKLDFLEASPCSAVSRFAEKCTAP